MPNYRPFRDSSLPIEARVEDLLGRLTLEQKAGQLTQYFYLSVAIDMAADSDLESVPEEHRALLQQPAMVQAAIRAGKAGAVLFVKDAAETNALQRLAVEEGPHGIPLLVGYDVIHGMRTIFPVPIALAATWDPDTAETSQSVAAREARAVGVNWTFAPMIDISRDPRWGRIVEGAGEDPHLASAMAAAQVRGFQGDLADAKVLAGPKHFAGYGASRGGRDYDDAEVSDSELWNVYFPPFRAAVEAGAANVMSAYMDLNGVPAAGNRWLLTDVLRDALGFDGFTVSDANAVRSMEVQHHARDLTDAAARAVTAGLDMEMTMFDPAYDRIPRAVAEGALSEADVDRAVRRVLTAKFRLGLFESPYVDEQAAPAVLAATDSRELARTAAEKSIVLLKNDHDTLPLSDERLGTIAVIGQLAVSKRDPLGPWVFDQDTAETVSILDGIRARVGEAAHVAFSPGAGITERMYPSPFDSVDPCVERTPEGYDDDAEIDRAVGLASAADVAIVVVGQRQNQIGEKASTSTLDLPGRQLEQLKRVQATGTPVVVVVMSGRPVELQWADANVAAIVQAWYPGTRGGDAVASVLFGDVSPAGRLPFTWPRHVGQLPMIYAHNRSFQPEGQGERYFDEPSTPLYPFGHGLGYASFTYRNLVVGDDSIRRGDTTTVCVDVTNESDRAADEVAQLYIHQRYGTSTRPIRELKGFARVRLAAGETRTIEFPLGPDHLRYWSAAVQGYVQDATAVDVWVGGTSTADLTATLIVV
ncbi:glycoside hydrolase family 3 N-terminal domain-containing protein [Streptomyces sp. NPDC002491]